MTIKEMIQYIITDQTLINHLIKENYDQILENDEVRRSIIGNKKDWSEFVQPVLDLKQVKKSKVERAYVVSKNVYRQIDWLINDVLKRGDMYE